MRVPLLVSDFFEWRWAPCVGLTAGSLTFVALALLLIPTHFGGEPRGESPLSSFDSSPQRAIFSSSLTGNSIEPAARRGEDIRVARSLPQPASPSNEMSIAGVAPRRGFSPTIDRPEPPPAPVPPPPAAVEPPAPTPAAAVVIQPETAASAREVNAP